MIKEDLIERAGYMAMRQAALHIPDDIFDAVKDAHQNESSADTRRVYDAFFEFAERRTRAGEVVCPDTGTIYYYISIGNVEIDRSIDFWRALARATVSLSREGILGQKSGDVVHHTNNNINVGENSPSIHYKLVPEIDYIEITALAKGGGGEMPGSKFRMLVPADGLHGIKKFFIDSAVSAAKGGLACPPTIFGLGVGGGIAIAASIAHEAAVLRPVGSRHPDKDIAAMEDELLEYINYIGVGPAGLGGHRTASDVHIEYSNGHMGVVATALVAQCLMAHRATVKLFADGRMELATAPEGWFTRPWRKSMSEVTK
ncbi:MAG: fumarate hydratase [Chloroflexi bacterium]|nr:fumarate hydratase [Chloroflexota bacterium]